METKVYDTENGEHVEETKDPNGNFYQKKVTKQGPGGVQSVSIVTSTSIGGGGGPAGVGDGVDPADRRRLYWRWQSSAYTGVWLVLQIV